MEQSVESNFFKKIRAIASITSQTSSIFQIIFITKSFFRKSSKPGHGNLVLITSTVQVDFSMLNFNFDDIRTYFLQVLRDCRQTPFVKLSGFYLLSKKKEKKKSHPLVPNGQYQDEWNTNQNFLHCISSFEVTSYKRYSHKSL